jgi:transcriptional regulator with XRE-family HTH domain
MAIKQPYAAIGARLTSVRTRLDMNQEAFAKELGVSTRSLAGYERGERPPTFEALAVLSDKHAVAADWLLFGLKPSLADDKAAMTVVETSIRNLLAELQDQGVAMPANKIAQCARMLIELELRSGQPLDPASFIAFATSPSMEV